jgi:hypothetical protein
MREKDRIYCCMVQEYEMPPNSDVDVAKIMPCCLVVPCSAPPLQCSPSLSVN